LPPNQPPQPPLGIWGGPWYPPYPSHGLPPFPAHPIVTPPPGKPPEGKPPEDWGWVYSPIYGWVVDPGAGGKPQPPPEETTPPPEVNPLA
jgi:hypothetical protein